MESILSVKETEISNKKSSQEYSNADNHSLNRGDDLVEKVTIKGDVYEVEVDDDGRSRLLRFNKKYRIWVSIEFIGVSDGLEKLVQDYLKAQYIRRVLESLKE